MTKYTNKSIVYHGCESHATLYHDNAMVDESEECGDIHSTSNVKNVTYESEEERSEEEVLAEFNIFEGINDNIYYIHQYYCFLCL